MIMQLPIGNQEVVVLFRLPAQIWADKIQLVGDFNGWSTSATPMRLGEQYWEARLTLPAGGRFFYAYLVDGQEWCTEVDTWARVKETEPPPVTVLPIAIPQAQREFSVHV
jgi:1,4-alpha-glucan branching enzyme